MKTIWKFQLDVTDRQTISVPVGTEILSVGVQNDKICLWALVNPVTNDKETLCIDIFGTGNPVDAGNRKFIGTVMMHGGTLVWHVFENISKYQPLG